MTTKEIIAARYQELQQAATPSPSQTQQQSTSAKQYSSNGRTGGNYAHQSYKENQFKTSTRGRMTDSGTRRKFYDDKAVEENQKNERIKNSNLSEVQAKMDAYTELADQEAKAITAKKKAEINNPSEAALLGGFFDNDINEARSQMDTIKKDLEKYGVKFNGSQVDASEYFKVYFDGQKAYASENNAPAVYKPENGLLEKSTVFNVDEYLDLVAADEMQLYNYLAARDKEAADVYRKYLNDQLEQRKGQARANEIMGMYNGPEKAIARGTEAFKAGLSGSVNAALASTPWADYKTSASQYAADALRTDLEARGKTTLGFDAAQSIGGMAPGVVAGMVNPTFGMVVFGATSAASATQEKLAEGWSESQAKNYGLLVGISEAAIGKVLGGIPQLGNSKLLNAITKEADNVLAKIAKEMGSEALEEGVQTWIEPAIESVVRNVPYDSPSFKETLYNAVLGAITAAGFGTVDAVTPKGNKSGGNIDPIEILTGIPSKNGKDTDVLEAKTLDELAAANNISMASAKVRSDEALMAELQQKVGRTLSTDSDVKAALAELQSKAAIEQKLKSAVDTGDVNLMEKALEEIASNPRELNVLNKYFGNIPGTEEGNIEYIKRIANGETDSAEQAVENAVEPQTAQGVQEIPAIEQTGQEQAPVRLNQQENVTGLPFAMSDDSIDAKSTGGNENVYTYGDNKDKSLDSRGREESRVDGYNQEKQGQPRSRVSKAAIEENLRSGARLIQENEYSEANKNTASIAARLGAKDFGIFDTRKAKNFPGGKGRSTVDNATGESYTSIAKGGDPGIASEGQVCAHECTHNAIAQAKWKNALKFGDEFVLRHPEAEKARRWFKQEHGEMYAKEMYDRGYYDLTPEQCEAIDARIYEELFCDLVAHINRAFDGADITALSKEVELALERDGVFPEGTFGQEYDQMIADSISLAQKEWGTSGVSARTSEGSKSEIYTQTETSNAYSGIDADPTIAANPNDDIFKKAERWTRAKDAERVQEQSEPSMPQSAPASRPQPTDDAELTALQMDEEREAANAEAEYQEQRSADKATPTVDDYKQQQREADRQAATPKYDIAHEYGEAAAKSLGDLDRRLGRLVDGQKVFSSDEKGRKVERSVSRLNNGKDILNKAREVMRGNAPLHEFLAEYNNVVGTSSEYLYTKDIADALNQAVSDVSSLNNTEYTQVTQEKKAKDITAAFQMLTHRAELAAEYKIVSAELNKQIQTKKSKASKIALGNLYSRWQVTPDTAWKALAGFDKSGNSEAYAIAEEALENNATEKRERSTGYSFFTEIAKHKDFDAFAKNKLMSGYKVGEYELTAQEAVSLLHSLRSIRAQTNDYIGGAPNRIVIDNGGVPVTLYDVYEENKGGISLKELEELVEKNVTGVAKEYSEALDKMFAHYSPKFMKAIEGVTGLTREAAKEGKYFPLFYRDSGDLSSFDISEALQSRFERLGFAKERVGPGSTLNIAPAAQIADNYIEQVSHYIGWANFSKKLEMLNANIDGTGSFLSAIERAYSKGAAEVFQNYIKDVGGYKRASDDSMMNQLLSKFAGAVITGKPSTAFSQLSSVYAAVGIIKPEAVRRAGIVFPIKQKHVNLDDGLLADRARHGINDSTISEISKNADSKIKGIIEKIPGGKGYLNLVGKADAYTTKQLYAACWCDVQMDYPEIQKNNQKLFNTLVEDKFMEALLFSQSDADRINNAAMYRTDKSFIRALGMFTGQPNKQLNMMVTALGEYNAAKGEAKKQAQEKLANTIKGQVGAAVSYSILKTVASLVLHKWYGLGDEEDELDAKEVALSALSESISTFNGMLWFGENVTDKLMYKITNGKMGNNFDVQINGLSQVVDLATNVIDMTKILNGEMPTAKEIKDLAFNISNVTGVPIQGAYDFANAFALWGIDAYNIIVNGGKPKTNYDIARYIDQKHKEKVKAETAAAKAEAKAEEDAIDMLINAGKDSSGDVETVYGKTALEISDLNKSIDAYKRDKSSEYDTKGDSSIAQIVLDAGLTTDGIDALIGENTSKPYRTAYNAMRALGLEPEEATETYSSIDADANSYLKQKELKAAYEKDPGIEYIIEAIWKDMQVANDWSTTWETYKNK